MRVPSMASPCAGIPDPGRHSVGRAGVPIHRGYRPGFLRVLSTRAVPR